MRATLWFALPCAALGALFALASLVNEGPSAPLLLYAAFILAVAVLFWCLHHWNLLGERFA